LTVETGAGAATERIDHAIESIHATIIGIRDFVTGLDPGGGATIDLSAGLTALAEEFERSTLVKVGLETESAVALDADDALQLIQLTREALSNVARHAAASNVSVRVEDRRDGLRLSIIDDGRGFDLKEDQQAGHHGLTNMRARTESLGGSLIIDSSVGNGTRVSFEMPHSQSRDEDESSS
jgi:two-component system NarL family sensor kinase